MIRRWSFKDSDAPRPDVFASLDPGEDGACAVFERGNPEPIELVYTALEADTIADLMARHGVQCILTEALFVGKGAMNALELASGLWTLVGWVARGIDPLDLDVIECSPSTWKAWVRVKQGWRGLKLGEKEERRRRLELLPWVSVGRTKAKADGAADAVHMGRAFLTLYP